MFLRPTSGGVSFGSLKQINSSSRFLFIYVFFLAFITSFFFLGRRVCEMYFPLPFHSLTFFWLAVLVISSLWARLYLIFIIKQLP